jgi:hypothetical protein
MNYTDQEILDLETSLDGVGHAKQVVLVLIEPDGWDQKVLGRFGPFMEKTHDGELYAQGLTTVVSIMLIPNVGVRSAFKITGPSIRATAALNELYDKYKCSMALDFTE